MKIVHKHEINIEPGAITTVELPRDSKPLTVEYLLSQRSLYLWVEVPADLNAELFAHQFHVFRTGDGIPSEHSYIGTAHDQYQPEAYHVYQAPTGL